MSRSQLVVEETPGGFQGIDAVVCIKQVIPSGALELEDMPWLIRVGVGGVSAVALGEDVQVAAVDPEMQDGDVVVD